MRSATVAVIGAGQAGLSTAFHLQRLGFGSALGAAPVVSLPVVPSPVVPAPSFVVLDAADAPGGAWQHRWESLRMATVNGIFDLPGMAKPPIDPDEPSRLAVPRYFADYERRFALPILRPVTVTAVRAEDSDARGRLLVESTAGTWRVDGVVNASGTWTNPVPAHHPGEETFLGRQLHTRDYRDLEEFRGHRVAVVGGGISAVQLLEEISRVAWTAWYTRREPVFLSGDFDPETTGRDTIARVTADVEAGLPSRSIVSYTGLGWSPYAIAARDRGALVRRPMFTAIEPHGVREADGTFTSVDTILWATGFRPDVRHLDPLELRDPAGGIRMHGTGAVRDPRIQLVGFGPSQSTVGANRAGRAAATELDRLLVPGA